MTEISLHKRQRIRLYLLNYVIVLFLSDISCLQLCQMFYRGQLRELYLQILDHKQSRRPPNFPSELRHCTDIKQHNRTNACIYTQKNSINNVAQNEQQTVFINLHNHKSVTIMPLITEASLINCLLQDEQKVIAGRRRWAPKQHNIDAQEHT